MIYLLTYFEYVHIKIMFKQGSRVEQEAAFFVNRNWMNIFGIWNRDREAFLVQLQDWWSDYERSHFLFKPSPLVFA